MHLGVRTELEAAEYAHVPTHIQSTPGMLHSRERTHLGDRQNGVTIDTPQTCVPCSWKWADLGGQSW